MLPAVCVLEAKAMLMIFCILGILSGVISTNSSRDKSSLCSWRSSLGAGSRSHPLRDVGAVLGAASWTTPVQAPRDGAQGECHSHDQPYPGPRHCRLHGVPSPAAVGGREPNSQSCSLSVPTTLPCRRGGLIAAGASDASQIDLLY